MCLLVCFPWTNILFFHIQNIHTFHNRMFIGGRKYTFHHNSVINCHGEILLECEWHHYHSINRKKRKCFRIYADLAQGSGIKMRVKYTYHLALQISHKPVQYYFLNTSKHYFQHWVINSVTELFHLWFSKQHKNILFSNLHHVALKKKNVLCHHVLYI